MALTLFDAFDRSTVRVGWRGIDAKLSTGHGLFSADRLDDGTRLLLDHLPNPIGGAVLDLGCGYGALGVPIARVYPDARVLMIDRDLVAVRYAQHNAGDSAEARPSLGCDAVPERGFALALCNVPARIGRAGLAHLIDGAASRLANDGTLLVVAIRDLVSIVEELGGERVADGPRHSVLRFAPRGWEAPIESPYGRDEIECAGLRFERAHDVSEDPGHAAEGAPLLAELLPRAPSSALVWRSAHGVMAVLLAMRGAKVVCGDRDLLALSYARRNASLHAVTIETRAAAWFPEMNETSLFIAAELTSSAGERVARAELDAIRGALTNDGHALVLAPAKLARSLELKVLASRGAWIVTRIVNQLT